MDKLELAKRLARLSRRSQGRAADEVDALVYDLLTNLKPSLDKSSEGRSSKANSSAAREKQ